MNSGKLVVEVIQNTQDLTRLLEKSVLLASQLYELYRELGEAGVPVELDPIIKAQNERLYDTFRKLEVVMYE